MDNVEFNNRSGFNPSNIGNGEIVVFTEDDVFKIGNPEISMERLFYMTENLKELLDDDLIHLANKYDLSDFSDLSILEINEEEGFYGGHSLALDLANWLEYDYKDGKEIIQGLDSELFNIIYDNIYDSNELGLYLTKLNIKYPVETLDDVDRSNGDLIRVVDLHCKEKYGLNYNIFESKISNEILSMIDKYSYMVKKVGETLGGHIENPISNTSYNIKLDPHLEYDNIFDNNIFVDRLEQSDDYDMENDYYYYLKDNYNIDPKEFIENTINPRFETLKGEINIIKSIISQNDNIKNIKNNLQDYDFMSIDKNYLLYVVEKYENNTQQLLKDFDSNMLLEFLNKLVDVVSPDFLEIENVRFDNWDSKMEDVIALHDGYQL